MRACGCARKAKARPIRARVVKPLPIPREVPEEPLTPGLRRKEGVTAIGFHADFVKGDIDEEFEEE